MIPEKLVESNRFKHILNVGNILTLFYNCFVDFNLNQSFKNPSRIPSDKNFSHLREYEVHKKRTFILNSINQFHLIFEEHEYPTFLSRDISCRSENGKSEKKIFDQKMPFNHEDR